MLGDGPSVQVATPRLLLRAQRPEDSAVLRPAAEDAEVRRWMPPAGPEPRLVVTERNTGRPVGSVAVRVDPGPPGTARISGWMAAPWRRHGYGAEVVGGLVGHAFDTGLRRTELLVATGNEAGQRLASRAGFRHEGQLRAAVPDGRDWVDAVLFGRLYGDPPSAVPRALPDVDALTDGTVTVRPLRAGDEDGLLAERLDALTRRWATTGRLWTAQDARAYVGQTTSLWLAGTEARFAIVDRDGTYAGSIGLRVTVSPFRVAEIGYGLRPGARGRGLTTRAVGLVADWAFTRAGVARLELGAAVDNVASRRVAERAGFRAEGVARLRLPTADGRRTDEVRYGLVPPG